MQAIATHVATSPYRANVLYVRIGLGLAGEGIPLTPCQASDTSCDSADYQADLRQLVAYGYTPQHWEAWQENMLTGYQQAFAPTTVIYPINALALNPTTGNPVQVDVAYWAAAHGFGVGAEGLVPVPNYRYADLQIILPYIRQHYPSTYIQFQTVSRVGSYDAIAGDIQTAGGFGARTVEWYESDITTASFQYLFQQWQQSVQSKFAGNVRKALPILRPFHLSFQQQDEQILTARRRVRSWPLIE